MATRYGERYQHSPNEIGILCQHYTGKLYKGTWLNSRVSYQWRKVGLTRQDLGGGTVVGLKRVGGVRRN